MKKITLTIILTLFSTQASFAKTYIAFFKVYRKDGSLLQLEENGNFSHVALSLGDKWLHSHPIRGVEIISNLNYAGFDRFEIVTLKNDSYKVLSKDYQFFLDKDYDYSFEWSDNKIYSSELIAKILKLKPSKMTFSASFWKKYPNLKGGLGISPDEIYRESKKLGFN